MSNTMQQQKRKLKKSYAQLLEEFLTARKRIAVVYIPLLSEALRDENPNWTYPEIKAKIIEDAVGQGWNEQYIIRCLPSWLVEDDPNHKRVKKNWETRHANALKSSIEKYEKLNREIPEPPEPIRQYDEDLDKELVGLGIGRYGEKGETLSTLYGNITESAADLFRALTEKDFMPHEDEDLVVDFIKPTREFRRGLVLELDKTKRTTLHNWLHYTSVAIEDMLRLIEEAEK